MSAQKIDEIFPNLLISGYSITSPATSEYNCIAWSAGDTEAWWWPDPLYTYYWPSGVPREETLESFIKGFETIGYTVCQNGEYEIGFEKIAIYVDSSGKPTHAARQLDSGSWTSKLGQLEDIEHNSLESIAGQIYGDVTVFMKRPVKNKHFNKLSLR